MKKNNILSWILQIITAIILFQTLFFKFSGATESIELFTKIGVEPWGRYLTGIVELITGILVLIPRTVLIGAIIGTATMIGAILSHLVVIGIESQNDGGLLFSLAIIVLVCSIGLIYIHKSQWDQLISQFFSIKSKN